jgi:hypothetical protein
MKSVTGIAIIPKRVIKMLVERKNVSVLSKKQKDRPI